MFKSRYPQEVREELRQLVAQRQAQLEDENIWKAEILTSGVSLMIKRCKKLEELKWVKQVIREQYAYLKPYSNLMDYLRNLWEQQAQYLRNYSVA